MPILQAEHPQRSLAIDSIINILFEVYSRVKTLEVIDQKAIETPPIIKIELPEYQKVLRAKLIGHNLKLEYIKDLKTRILRMCLNSESK